MKKTSKEIIEKQSRKILELESQLASTYHLASVEIKNASEERLIGSGVLVQLTGIGGKNIVMPFLHKIQWTIFAFPSFHAKNLKDAKPFLRFLDCSNLDSPVS